MTADGAQPASAADLLYDLRITNTTIGTLPPKLRPTDLAAAYAVQSELVDRLQKRYGGSPIGYKIACTNANAQKLLNTGAPVFGRLSSCFTRSSPARVNGKEFAVLGIEPEIAFEIAADVPPGGGPYTAESIIDYVSVAMPAIELVGHRFSHWDRFDGPTLVADNAIHQAWIPGRKTRKWRELDLAHHPAELVINGVAVLFGSGANVLGNPLNALAWLANELPAWGLALRAGDRVTTGTCTDVHLASIGDRIRADFADLGGVELELE